jgi:hypothetical protein
MIQGEPNLALEMIHQALGNEPLSALTAGIHLQILRAQDLQNGQAGNPAIIETRRRLAEYNHRRWPEALPVAYLLAEWMMLSGEVEPGVALLHETAVRDISGQVAERLWGPLHPYRSIWPKEADLDLNLTIPAEIVADLGWNRLPAGITGPVLFDSAPTETPPAGLRAFAQARLEAAQKAVHSQSPTFQSPKSVQPVASTVSPPTHAPELDAIRQELGQIAERLNRPGLFEQDGRFPIYVLFSHFGRLATKYAKKDALEIETRLNEIVRAIQSNPVQTPGQRWGARLVWADQAECLTPLGIQPVATGDPEELKRLIIDLNQALAKRGERIGALLVVGGPDIVPFHSYPNPVDDPDSEILSDNPYAVSQGAGLIPEWPVGRLPDGAISGDGAPVFLIDTLKRLASDRQSRVMNASLARRWLDILFENFRSLGPGAARSFAYSAAVWKDVSTQVFRPIGRGGMTLASPPTQSSPDHPVARHLPPARIAHFNLHGLTDAPEWFGQRNPLDTPIGPDYPIALRPADFGFNGRSAPQVIFSEACYGAYLTGKNVQNSICLAALASGCRAFAGSTVIAYGSAGLPQGDEYHSLVAADYLGRAFWANLRIGLPAGEALRRARLELAREMQDRQGFLDSGDQKTLLSFVLYGDPLAQPFTASRAGKSVHSSQGRQPTCDTLCEAQPLPESTPAVDDRTLGAVKQIVAKYLPGMIDAEMHMAGAGCGACASSNPTCPSAALGRKHVPTSNAGRRVVTLKKGLDRSNNPHLQVARLTLDDQDRVIKLIVSR